MQQYYISGIWTSALEGQPYITHVLLHQTNVNNSFGKGKKVTTDKIVKLIRSGDVTINTLEWSYKFREWQKGVEVDFEKINDVDYLRTKRDNKLFDNLGNLLPMKVLIATLVN